ncbi:sigma-70 family RNA polymerase sigma factor [Nocardia acidivorans]|uniref:sigma-70 family RNA polymerase sigma factor n=1 Tax=Nocardia acidivorans TaxID=404580 RepID=UPI00083056E1|nr:sigma-70 family RNA polymerase sigma factor [Nocardia acidivorans]
MGADAGLARAFEGERGHLTAVAYRMLGSLSEADDAVQEAWIRLARSESDAIENLAGWLTTVVGRVCLDMLRARKSRGEESVREYQLPDPVVGYAEEVDPEQRALLADSVGLAMLVVLEALSPAERLSFVLHDMFAVPYEQIAPIVGRTPQTAKKLASQARRRVRGQELVPDADPRRRRRVVEAFLAAAREGEFEALLAILDPGVVLRADSGPGGVRVFRGAREVAALASTFQKMAMLYTAHAALINGAAGLVNTDGETVRSIIGFTVVNGKIAAMDLLTDPERLAGIEPPR